MLDLSGDLAGVAVVEPTATNTSQTDTDLEIKAEDFDSNNSPDESDTQPDAKRSKIEPKDHPEGCFDIDAVDPKKASKKNPGKKAKHEKEAAKATTGEKGNGEKRSRNPSKKNPKTQGKLIATMISKEEDDPILKRKEAGDSWKLITEKVNLQFGTEHTPLQLKNRYNKTLKNRQLEWQDTDIEDLQNAIEDVVGVNKYKWIIKAFEEVSVNMELVKAKGAVLKKIKALERGLKKGASVEKEELEGNESA